MKQIKKDKYMLKIIMLITILLVLVGCSDGSRFDRLILTDMKTGKKYLMKHNAGDAYFIDEGKIEVNGTDTTIIFENN
jgi:hypothetical protein